MRFILQEGFTSPNECPNISAKIFEGATIIKPFSANPTKWSNTLKQFVCNLPTHCLSVFDHFVKLALKGLRC